MTELLKYKVGCDPEFSILNDGQRVHAFKCIEGLFADDPRRDEHTLQTDGGEFGCDGCASTGELRPKPALEPKEVAANIRECVAAFMEKGGNYELSTLSLWAPVGGHIHLELPPGDWSEDKLANVHKRLMSYYLPVLMGEHKTDLALRQRSYGQITDYRCDGGSERRTMEVRCPSAEWLTSERTATAVLAYMSAVWHEVWDRPENLDKRLVLKTMQQEKALQELAVSEFDAVTKALMRDIAKNVRKFALYPAFKAEIDFVLRPDRVLEEKKRHNFTLNSGWGFGTRKAASANNKKKFLRAPETRDGNASGLGFAHNGDLNTGILCDEMRARALGGFAFKNGYYFYGLKEGLEGHIVSSEGTVYAAPAVATADEAERVRQTARRMDDRAYGQCGTVSKLKLDFKTAKITEENRKTFAIGVPHKERAAKRFRPTLELVWALEKGKLAPEGVRLVPKADGPSLPTDLSVEAGADAQETDRESQGFSFALSAVREVMRGQRERELAEAAQDERRGREGELDGLLRRAPVAHTQYGPAAIVALEPGRNVCWGLIPGSRSGRATWLALDGREGGYVFIQSGEYADAERRDGEMGVLVDGELLPGVRIRYAATEGSLAVAMNLAQAEAETREEEETEEEEEDYKLNRNRVCAE